MPNSFTFKNPKSASFFHDAKNASTIISMSYIGWHWTYQAETKKLVVHFDIQPTKWLDKLPEKHFSINVQTPTYWYDPRRSVKRKPQYEKADVDWDKNNSLNIVDVKFVKEGYSGYLTFNQTVSNFHGDSIMGLHQSMQGFWKEFRALLKESKTCDADELNQLLTLMNCRLITYNTNSMTPQQINTPLISFKYDQSIQTIDTPIDLPW